MHVWRKLEDALAGRWADVVLGEEGFEDLQAELGQDKLFWPAGVCFDGSYLWIAEVKFSERLLRFSPAP